MRPLIQWMKCLFPLIWLLGACFVIDDMKIGFQGMQAEGGGFQVDALCENGFWFQFYFRNDPANVEYTKTGILPLHYRVMTLFDSVEDNYHRRDNCLQPNQTMSPSPREWPHISYVWYKFQTPPFPFQNLSSNSGSCNFNCKYEKMF